MDYAEVLSILAFFGSFWLAVTTIAVTSITTRYFRLRREQQLGFELAMEAFSKHAKASEVERLLLAFGGDRKRAKWLSEGMVPPEKTISAGQV